MIHSSAKLASLLLVTIAFGCAFHAAHATVDERCEEFKELWLSLVSNETRPECSLSAINNTSTQEDYAIFCETCDLHERFQTLRAAWSQWTEANDFEGSCEALDPNSGEMRPAGEILREFNHKLAGFCLKASDEYCHPDLAELKAFMSEALEEIHDRTRHRVFNRSDWPTANRSDWDMGDLKLPNRSRWSPGDHFDFNRSDLSMRDRFEFLRNMSHDDSAPLNRSEFADDIREIIQDRLSEVMNRTGLDISWEQGDYCASTCTRAAAAFARYIRAAIQDAGRQRDQMFSFIGERIGRDGDGDGASIGERMQELAEQGREGAGAEMGRERNEEGRTTGDRTEEERTTGERKEEGRTTGDRTEEERTMGDRTEEERTTGDRTEEERTTGERTEEERTMGNRIGDAIGERIGDEALGERIAERMGDMEGLDEEGVRERVRDLLGSEMEDMEDEDVRERVREFLEGEMQGMGDEERIRDFVQGARGSMGGDAVGRVRDSIEDRGRPVIEDDAFAKIFAFINAYCDGARNGTVSGAQEWRGSVPAQVAGATRRVMRMRAFLGMSREDFTEERRVALRWAIGRALLRDGRELDAEQVSITGVEESGRERRLLAADGLIVTAEAQLPDDVSEEHVNEADEVNANANQELSNLGIDGMELLVDSLDIVDAQDQPEGTSVLGEEAQESADEPVDGGDDDEDDEEEEEKEKPRLVVVIVVAVLGGALVAAVVVFCIRRNAASKAASTPVVVQPAVVGAKEDLVYGLTPDGITPLEAVQSKV